MLVAFLMTLYAGILSPLDSGVQSTDTVSTHAQQVQVVEQAFGPTCGIGWPTNACPPPPVKRSDDGGISWPDPNAQLQLDPGQPGGIGWPLAAPPTNPGIGWPSV
jgi:hypothetical protein